MSCGTLESAVLGRIGGARRPNVLHVRVLGNHGGGPDKTILRSASYVHASVDMAAAYLHSSGDDGITTIRKQAERWACPLHDIAESGPFDARTPGRLLKLCRQRGVTIWHAHDYKSDLLGLLLRRFHPMRVVTTVHGYVGATSRLRCYEAIDRHVLRWFDHVVAVSPLLHAMCLEHGVPASRLSHVPNAIEPHEYQRRQTSDKAKAQLGARPEQSVVGCVGRLSPEKRVDRALALVAQLRAQNLDIALHIVGDGPCLGQLQHQAERLGLGSSVTFHGWQQDAQPIYEAMDLLLLTSATEGLPNTLLEAMCLSVPVAATNVGGIAGLLDNGRCGVLLDDDSSCWSTQVEPLLRWAALREQLASVGRQRILEHYSFATRMRRMVGIYEGVTGAAAAQRYAA